MFIIFESVRRVVMVTSSSSECSAVLLQCLFGEEYYWPKICGEESIALFNGADVIGIITSSIAYE